MKEPASPYNQDYTAYQLGRSRLRKFIRRAYLKHILKFVKGRAVDFGCGVGELLSMLPDGSLGFEINEATVKYCTGIGLNVKLYSPESDRYEFSGYGTGMFSTFIMAHVLEHFEDPHTVLRTILGSCSRMGIERFILIVPGMKGFMFDKTHKTFIDRRYLEEHDLYRVHGYCIMKEKYFPLGFSWAGRLFTYNETLFIYDRIA